MSLDKNHKYIKNIFRGKTEMQLKYLLLIGVLISTISCSNSPSSKRSEDVREAETAWDLMHDKPVSIDDYIALNTESSYSELVLKRDREFRVACDHKGLSADKVREFLKKNKFKVIRVKE